MLGCSRTRAAISLTAIGPSASCSSVSTRDRLSPIGGAAGSGRKSLLASISTIFTCMFVENNHTSEPYGGRSDGHGEGSRLRSPIAADLGSLLGHLSDDQEYARTKAIIWFSRRRAHVRHNSVVCLMSLRDYQKAALRTAAPKDKPNELLHLVLGLVGESGEIAEKFKKWIRDQGSDERRIDREDVAEELGDVLWYLAVLADYLGLDLDDIAQANVDKLASRQARGVLGGAGDHR